MRKASAFATQTTADEVTDDSFGGYLRQYRQEHDLTQTELASLLNVSSATLCDLELGRKVASPRRALSIACRLGLSEPEVLQLVLTDLLRRERRDFQVFVAERGGKKGPR